MKTIADFLNACMCPAVDVYETFYNADDELQDAIYAEGAFLVDNLKGLHEPTRAIMNALGDLWDVKSLKDY